MKKNQAAFTLIEMLVVIAIISIVAAMVVGMANAAKNQQHRAQVEGNKQKLIVLIADYQSKLNFYPPDNAYLTNYGLRSYNAADYDLWTATNPLAYELAGATNNYANSGNILAFDGSSNISLTLYNQIFGREGVLNSNPDEPHSFFVPQPKEYTNYYFSPPNINVWGLVVPISLTPKGANYWHYDASSTNRHNLNSYDLWAEYLAGTKGGSNIIITNGNW